MKFSTSLVLEVLEANGALHTSTRETVIFKLSCAVDVRWKSVMMALLRRALFACNLLKFNSKFHGSMKGSHKTCHHYMQVINPK